MEVEAGGVFFRRAVEVMKDDCSDYRNLPLKHRSRQPQSFRVKSWSGLGILEPPHECSLGSAEETEFHSLDKNRHCKFSKNGAAHRSSAVCRHITRGARQLCTV